MQISHADQLIVWTIRLALIGWTAGMALRLTRPAWCTWARFAWTFGLTLYLLHVLAAFGLRHNWRHADAVRETARQTEELFGLDWGWGIWFNHAFTVVWLADAILWWLKGHEPYLAFPRAARLARDGFMIFMVLQATAVFGGGIVRWAGLVGCLVLAALVVGVAPLGGGLRGSPTAPPPQGGTPTTRP